jgi:hypothetical protein
MVITNGGLTYNNFYPNGYYNSKNAWISDDENKRIVWDNVQNYWYVSGSSYNIINTNTTYPPINGWQLLGSPATISVSLGECEIVTNLSGNAVINNPTCSCDGSVTLTALDGVPPYQYSINNGNTFGDSPLFNGLCGGVYSWVIKDSEDNIFSGVETLNQPSEIIIYTLSLVRTTTSTNNSMIIGANTFTQKYVVRVTPPLPVGTTLTFDLTCPSFYRVSPNPNSYLVTINNTLTKNGLNIPVSSNNLERTTLLMQGVCNTSTNKTYNYENSAVWNNITISNGETIILDSVVTSTYNCENSTPEVSPPPLYEIGDIYSIDLEDYSIGSTCCSSIIYNDGVATVNNVRISGCQCCYGTIGWGYFYNRS